MEETRGWNRCWKFVVGAKERRDSIRRPTLRVGGIRSKAGLNIEGLWFAVGKARKWRFSLDSD